MVRAWKSFSIFAVLALIFLLAPVVILLPGENVAQAQGVVQEVEASFSFTEDSPGGDWWNFTAGSGGINATYGLCLEQYTRENVVRNTTLAGCEFRNYTAANGTVSGDLNGTMWVSWLTFKFNQTYPYTPKYNETFTATDFGWMAGRGHFYDGTNPNDNFTFVFVLDFDSNDNMSVAGGKGFMVSVNETGTFVGHKIIGDFDISKSGLNYTGNFHLRNYDPSEVYDQGNVNTTGPVMFELRDDIHKGLDLLDYTSDGPQPTPIDVATRFEEIAWGKDPTKTVTSGHLGVNGTINLRWNSVQYGKMIAGSPSWFYGQGTVACNLYINDTYAVTGDDGSSFGELWGLLLHYLPYQELPEGDFCEQNGYTLTHFGLPNSSTECYAGTESFGVNHVMLEVCLGNRAHHSTDHWYSLYPHPRVTSVSPSTGSLGTTMNVTIGGKYFLRTDDFASNTGSVSFGPNITVNSYTIKNNSSPIDNEITASITIQPGASTGARDVNVTSCFGYSHGNGTAPYLSGVLTDGFCIGEYCNLTVNVTPSAGGNITVNGTTPPNYPNMTTWDCGDNVTLNATAASGYSFVSWSGNLSGNVNPRNITMSGNKTVTANFVLFTAPANVDVTAADPGIESIDVSSVELSEVNITNMPEDVEAQEAYVVNSTGTGNFTLSFTGIANAESTVVYKVTDSDWVQLAAAGSGTTLEVTIPAGDPPVVFCTPTGAPPPVGGTVYPVNKLGILAPWIALLAAIIAGASVLMLRRRRT